MIHLLLEELREGYAQEPAYQVLVRFFADNFRLEDQAVRTKTNQELEADSLQSVRRPGSHLSQERLCGITKAMWPI